MLLPNTADRNLMRFLVERGGAKFVKSLCILRVTHQSKPDTTVPKAIRKQAPHEKTKCLVCRKTVGAKKSVAWVLANKSGTPVFKNRFDSDVCADRAKRWLMSLLIAWSEYLGPEEKKQLKFTEDDLRDNFPLIKDDENLRDFTTRYKKHLDHLEEITPQFEEGERIEDHQ